MSLQCSSKLRYAGKKLAIIALALLMLVSILPNALPSARAALEENQSAVSAGDAVNTDDKAVSSGDAEDEGNALVSAGDVSASDVMLLAEDYGTLQITFTTSKAVGSTLPMTVKLLSGGEIYIDWGDGNIVPYDASGTTKGDTIKIYSTGDIYSFTCNNSGLTTIDVSNATKMADLEAENNALTSVSVNTGMQLLYLDNNALTELDISGCTGIRSIYCSNNQLSELDVSGQTLLQTLECKYNQLTSLNVTGCSNLNYLQCPNNQLSGLDVTTCTNLKQLYCNNNQINGELDVAKNTALTVLLCGDNLISTLNVTQCTKLTRLDCGNNQLQSLDVSKCPKIYKLLCDNNQISGELDISACAAELEELECSYNQISALDVSNCTILDKLYCYNNQIKELDVADCAKLEYLMCQNNQIDELVIGDKASLKTLKCGNNQMSTLTMGDCTVLNIFDCSSNQISELDVTGCPLVTSLNCNDNQIAELDITNCTKLNNLTCQNNELTFSTFDTDLSGIRFKEYSPQAKVELPAEAEFYSGIDLSAEYDINGTITEFTWYDAATGDVITPKTSENGKFTFDVADVGKALYCKMTNANYPELTLQTTEFEITTSDFTLTFDVNGGDALPTDKQSKTVTCTLPVGELPAATRTGYTLDGWFDGSGTEYTADTVYNVQADTTLTAQWTINEYDVNYHITDISEHPTKGVLPGTDTLEHGTAYTAKFPAAIDGFTFFGWYTDEGYTAEFVDGTPITADTDLYGHWTRDGALLGGALTWVENGEGFVRPDSVTVNFYQNGTLIDTCVVPKDETADVQYYSFDEVFVTDMDSNPYVYTVDIDTVPENYVSVVSGLDITNTYNVNTYTIIKEWDNTGNPDELPASVAVELYCDGTLYRTVTLTEANGWSQTVTVPRLIAQDSTFTVKEIAVPGFSSVYEAPAPKDTDGDGTADAITYVISNTYIMPQITVSGDIAWDKVPDGMTEPDMTVNLVLDGAVIDTVTVPAGVSAYSFGELDRYDDEGNALAYTVEVEDIADYDAVTAAPATDADGNIDIDITATGTFTYGALTISNTVTGEDAPADAEFVYTVTFDSTVSYPYTGSAAGTIKSGDKITLKAGQSITIADILVGVKFDVTQDEAEDFVTSPSTGKIEGVISATPSVAAFSNACNPPVVTGNLTITNKVTGDKADTSLKFSFKVEFDAQGSYELRIYGAGEAVPANTTGMLGGMSISAAAGARATTGTIKSGDTIQLAHGETAVIYGLPAGTTYKVTETENKGYKMTSTGASGTVSQDGAKASFINEKIKASTGDNKVPDTGDYGTNQTAAIAVMHIALLAALLFVFCMNKLRENSEAEAL